MLDTRAQPLSATSTPSTLKLLSKHQQYKTTLDSYPSKIPHSASASHSTHNSPQSLPPPTPYTPNKHPHSDCTSLVQFFETQKKKPPFPRVNDLLQILQLLTHILLTTRRIPTPRLRHHRLPLITPQPLGQRLKRIRYIILHTLCMRPRVIRIKILVHIHDQSVNPSIRIPHLRQRRRTP